MNHQEQVYIGIKGCVIALDRATGQQIWTTHLKGSSFVSVHASGGYLIAVAEGEVFAIDAATGEARWHNPLKGFGRGLASIATEDGLRTGLLEVLAQKQRQDEQARAAAAAAAG